MIQMIPLKKLAVSPHNVRKHDVMFDLSGLAASILARGLLQNLIGTAAKKKGHFDITAGGRRLRALGLLLANGDIADTFEVPVVVLEGSGADHAETSLAENFHRLAMTPADECTAFKHFLGELAEIRRSQLGLGWITPILAPRVTWDDTSSLYEVSGEQPELSDAELTRIEVIETEQSEIGDTLNEGDDENGEILSARYEALDQELSALENRPSVIAEALRGQVGQFMILSGEGEPLLDNRYFSREPIDGIHNQPTTRSTPATTASLVAKTEGLSAKLIDELAMQRRDLLSVHVASDPSLALDLTIFLLAERASGTHSLGSAKSTLEARRPNDPVFGDKVPATNAKIHLGEIGEALDRSWCEFDTVAARFDAFRAIDDSSRAAWLSYCVAKSLEASTGVVGAAHYSGFHNHIGTALEIDTASWWRPTAANYFARVRKQQLLKVLEEIGGPTLSSRYSAAKQSELAVACEMLCAGTAQVEPEVRERALAWVPNVMRFDCTVEDNAGDEDRDQADDAASDVDDDAVTGDEEDAVTNELAEQDTDADEPANA